MKPKDQRDPGFWITDNEVIEVHGPTIGPFGVTVYCALAMHAGQRGTCDPSISMIAAQTGISPRKVRSTIGVLAGVGLISVEHRPTGAGNNHEPNAYTLLPVVKMAKYTGQPTAPHAVPTAPCAVASPPPTAQGAEPLRHVVPVPTARGAYKQELTRTIQDITSVDVVEQDAAPLAPAAPDAQPTAVEETPATHANGAKPKSTRGAVQPPEYHELYAVLAEVCRLNLQTIAVGARKNLDAAAKRLLAAGTTPAQVKVSEASWYRQDWRGKKGQAPTPSQIMERIGADMLPRSSSATGRGVSAVSTFGSDPNDPSGYKAYLARQNAMTGRPPAGGKP